MTIEMKSFFEQYEKIRSEADQVFSIIAKQCPTEVKCHQGCTDCCYALFDLCLIEAMYISHKFHSTITGDLKQSILDAADRADRRIYKLKKEAYKSNQLGVDPEKILLEIGSQKVRCPFLSVEDKCILYEYRPIICRVYGVPLVVGDEVRSCKFSGFKQGEKYPTVFIEKIQKRLSDLCIEFVRSIPTKYTKLHEVLVPLSMALLTEYDDSYLGLVEARERPDSGLDQWTIGEQEDNNGSK